jgi:hypothetical protein
MRRAFASTLAAALVFAAGLVLGGAIVARADQPHMERALSQLQAALGELQEAAHDKGGHRAKAVDLVKNAIEQVQLGIDAGRD